MSETCFFVYMLRCGDNSLYTGYTNDVEKRLRAHAQGLGAKYTRSHLPVKLAGYWPCSSKREALQIEAAIKRLPREKKEALLSHFKSGAPLSITQFLHQDCRDN